MNKFKIISLVFVLILVSRYGYSQDQRVGFHFGPKIGINLANMWDSEENESPTQYRTGIAGGAFVSIPLGSLFAIQPEVMYSSKGYRSSGSFLGSEYEFSHRENFLDIPLLFAVRPAPFISFLIGPQVNFLLNEKNSFKTGDFSASDKETFENDNIRKNRIGGQAGVDFMIQKFILSARASMDFQDNKGDGTNENPRYKNFFFQFAVGYSF